jgi:lysophospholipase L1-like esterase
MWCSASIKTIVKASCLILLFIPTGYLLARFIAYTQNSLFLNDEWIVSKRMTKMGLTGADEFLLDRYSLAGNKLNLERSFGFQEVVSRQSYNPRTIHLKIEIEKDSFLDVAFRNKAGEHGYRIFPKNTKESFKFFSSIDGEWIVHKIEEKPRLIANKLTDITLTFDPSVSGNIVLRSGERGAKISKIRVVEQSGQKSLYTFSASFSILRMAVCLTILGFMVVALVKAAGRRRLLPNTREGIYSWIMPSMTMFIIVALVYSFDFLIYSAYPPESSALTRLLSADELRNKRDFEEYRHELFASIFKLFGGEKITLESIETRGYPVERHWQGPILCLSGEKQCQIYSSFDDTGLAQGENLRAVFIGTSQTVGAGASELHQSFFTRLFLSSQNDGVLSEFDFLNLSISGKTSTQLFEKFYQYSEIYRPGLIVLNLGFNDRDSDLFIQNLSTFLNFVDGMNMPVFLVQEAISKTSSIEQSHFVTNHQTILQLAKQFDHTVVPLHKEIGRLEYSSFAPLWWDFIHFNDLGHKKVAKIVKRYMLREMTILPPN